SPTQVDITWEPAERAITYTVNRSENGDWTPISSGLTTTKFSDTTVKPNTSYSYTVTAVNGNHESDPSEVVGAQTPPLLTSSPTMPDTVNLTPPPDPSTDSSTVSDTN